MCVPSGCRVSSLDSLTWELLLKTPISILMFENSPVNRRSRRSTSFEIYTTFAFLDHMQSAKHGSFDGNLSKSGYSERVAGDAEILR